MKSKRALQSWLTRIFWGFDTKDIKYKAENKNGLVIKQSRFFIKPGFNIKSAGISIGCRWILKKYPEQYNILKRNINPLILFSLKNVFSDASPLNPDRLPVPSAYCFPEIPLRSIIVLI
jgi:hypothetical protein